MVKNDPILTKYLENVPEDRKNALVELVSVIDKNLPEGFEFVSNYGMLGWVIPLSDYPDGYHCAVNTPLPFVNVANQKGFIAFYHMGIYADQDLLKWFQEEYAKVSKYKLDMGKSCVRFKKMDDIPYQLIGKLASKITPKQWIATYEKLYKKKK